MPTWFLPPDFSFSSDGPLQLGTVLSHPSRPTLVLASIDGSSHPEIVLPKVDTVTEKNHTHSNSRSQSNEFSIWAKFLEVASTSIKTNVGSHAALTYGTADHQIKMFAQPFSAEALLAISNLPAVRGQIDSGMFGKRPLYVVSGLRIAQQSFEVKTEVGSNFNTELSGSGPAAGGIAPVEVGASVAHHRAKTVTDSYNTAAGVVFAYRLHVVRPKRAGPQGELFSHKSAFMTGEGSGSEEPPIMVEADKQELKDDIEEEIEFTESTIGDDICISFDSEKGNGMAK
ncbi:hypothetical protein BT63DRAFT_423112 [Microthyrium microscopicum]|uniref:Uncharacterized protein n=1 Tax=Microthyrium microscopicum TaxID=703497 RepID=A0A6A6UHA5_9PEZI|nr:hypothetical protein BT63DRAFT_423112 [Microthyrium microscopicum]